MRHTNPDSAGTGYPGARTSLQRRLRGLKAVRQGEDSTYKRSTPTRELIRAHSCWDIPAQAVASILFVLQATHQTVLAVSRLIFEKILYQVVLQKHGIHLIIITLPVFVFAHETVLAVSRLISQTRSYHTLLLLAAAYKNIFKLRMNYGIVVRRTSDATESQTALLRSTYYTQVKVYVAARA